MFINALRTLLAAALFSTSPLAAAGTPAPQGFLDLLATPTHGGELLRPDNFDLTQPNASWQNQPGATMVYEQTYDTHGSYRLDFTLGQGIRGLWSINRAPMKPNRRYTVSALIQADFDREDVEINLGFRPFDPAINYVLPGSREAGLPAITKGPDGWERWEWSFVSPSIPDLPDGALTLWVYVNEPGEPLELRIADFAAIEMPIEAATNFAPGQGVTFRGGPGAMPMAVEQVTQTQNAITVRTTGAIYRFDKLTGEISATQQLEQQREVARFQTGLDLSDLAVTSENAVEVVLQSTEVTFGIQCDSVLVVSPHEPGASFRATSSIKAPMTRFARGHLFAKDTFGGFTVNPLPGIGSGDLAIASPTDNTLDFLSFGEVDTLSLSKAEPGWAIDWTLQPGERIFLSVFPPRPFDWERSFTENWFLTFTENPIPSYATNRPFVTLWLLWDFAQRAWAMSHSTQYTPIDDNELTEHIQTIQANGDKAFPYMSAWFHQTRDPEVFVGEVERWMNDYGVDGMYSDGLPAVEWLVAYEEMRMLRELVGDGPLIIHDSVPQSGRSLSMFQPFTFTYADFVYMGEGTPSDTGPNWPWAQFVISQYRTSNAFGTIKGDAWNFPDGSPLNLTKDLATLVFGGRARAGQIGYVEQYLPMLDTLRQQWTADGDKPNYYDAHYLPLARELTGLRIGPSAMPIIQRNRQADGTDRAILAAIPSQINIHYTIDGTTPTDQSPLATSNPIALQCDATLRAIAIEPDLNASPILISAPLTPLCCPGDTNNDNTVDLTDLNAVLALFGQPTTSGADLDNSGAVDLADLNIVLSAFGSIWNCSQSKP